MTNFFELYDRLTGRWNRVRAHFLSHLIAAGLLWVIDFDPSFARLDLRSMSSVANPSNPLLESVGLLAAASFMAAVLVGLYTIVLDELGRVCMNLLFRLFPPQAHLERWEEAVPRATWFTIAATLPPGQYEGRALRQRASELLAVYMMKHKPEFAAVANEDIDLRQDLYTHLRNSLLFLIIWLALPLLLPSGHAVAQEVIRVHGGGTAAFLLYFVISHARMAAASVRSYPRLYDALSTLILRDEAHSQRIAAAHANQRPYWNLVEAMMREDRPVEPSLKLYLRRRIRLHGIGTRLARRVSEALEELKAVGIDRDLLADYERSDWVGRYLRWRAARALIDLGERLRCLLRRLGCETG
jgi:GNAT superfamily N-acetyltransferase